MNGHIFSIEEFSTFDGPGIRTTVFLKGCPLHCQWCHNPEGQQYSPQLLRSPNGCLGCGACLEAGKRKSGIPMLVEESIAACPQNLIRMCGESISANALIARLEKMLWMLNTAGGGITFSGGEPLSQPEFLLECLQLLHGKAHRAIQTSGYASSAVFQKVLDNCEYMLFDLKHMDPHLHKKFTGVTNTQILRNFQILATSGIPFTVRIPLIPGVNDTADNLTKTARFLQQNSVRRVELLPYNTAAGAKYKAVGRQYAVDFDPTQRPQPRADIFKQFDIEVQML